MALRIAFFNGVDPLTKVDLSKPELGNPGLGGTQFAFASLPHYLVRHCGCEIEPVLYTNAVLKHPASYRVSLVQDELDALRKAKQDACAAFVIWPNDNVTQTVLALADEIGMPVVIWAHNHLSPERQAIFSKAACVRRVVCVGENQWSLLAGTEVFEKAEFIFCGFDLSAYAPETPVGKEPLSVVYMGSLIPVKGFPIVASMWKPVLKAFPEARLHVIGGGQLYSRGAPLGSLGIASQRFEDSFIKPNLTDEKGALLPSVKFHGIVDAGTKISLLRRMQVGIVNPSGETECCPVSTLEMQACGTPVVSAARLGLIDTVVHERSGLLGRDPNEQLQFCALLLRNPKLAEDMGRNGIAFVKRKFDYARICRQWVSLFKSLPDFSGQGA